MLAARGPAHKAACRDAGNARQDRDGSQLLETPVLQKVTAGTCLVVPMFQQEPPVHMEMVSCGRDDRSDRLQAIRTGGQRLARLVAQVAALEVLVTGRDI